MSLCSQVYVCVYTQVYVHMHTHVHVLSVYARAIYAHKIHIVRGSAYINECLQDLRQLVLQSFQMACRLVQRCSSVCAAAYVGWLSAALSDHFASARFQKVLRSSVSCRLPLNVRSTAALSPCVVRRKLGPTTERPELGRLCDVSGCHDHARTLPLIPANTPQAHGALSKRKQPRNFAQTFCR